jgi:NADH-quinone oxidoreductase subunit J
MSGFSVALVAVAAVTCFGALYAVYSKSMLHALLGLMLAMLGVGFLYIFLDSPLLAMMQILVYIGVVGVVIAFAIKMAGPFYRDPWELKTRGRVITFSVLSLVALGIMSWFMVRGLPQGPPQPGPSTRDLGRAFLDTYPLPFELISLLVVVGIIGAIMLAIHSEEES